MVQTIEQIYNNYISTLRLEKTRSELEDKILKKYFSIRTDSKSLKQIIFKLINDILACNQCEYYKFLNNKQLSEAKMLLEDNQQFKNEIHQIFCHSQFRLTQIVIFIIQFSRQRLQTQLDSIEKIINNHYRIISEIDKKKGFNHSSKSLTKLSPQKIRSSQNPPNNEPDVYLSPDSKNYCPSHKASFSSSEMKNTGRDHAQSHLKQSYCGSSNPASANGLPGGYYFRIRQNPSSAQNSQALLDHSIKNKRPTADPSSRTAAQQRELAKTHYK